MGSNLGFVPSPYGIQHASAAPEAFESIPIAASRAGQPESLNPQLLPRPIGSLLESAVAPPATIWSSGSCSPAAMRLTVTAVPGSAVLRARWHLPLGVIVHPMADAEVGAPPTPVIQLSGSSIIRCRRCRTYMSPFMQWVDSGRRFKCNVCALLNEIPADYYQPLDQNGRRRDYLERPELSQGSVEYVAPAEYMVRAPMPPAYLFVLDVSPTAVTSGLLAVAADTIRRNLDQLPGEERTRVGILTYDSALHFYRIRPGGAPAQMLVVSDLDEPFLPCPDDLLVNLNECRASIDGLLESLPNMFASAAMGGSMGASTTTTNPALSTPITATAAAAAAAASSAVALGPALQAAFLALSSMGGKLVLVQAAPASLGTGAARGPRDSLSYMNTDKESLMRNPEDPFFKRFAAECSRVQITVDCFVGSGSAPTDLAAIAAVARFTCGEVQHYPNFLASRDGVKFAAELSRSLVRETAWEAVIRIRCSRGMKVSSFHGHFFNRSTDLLALPTCDPDKTFAVQLALEEAVLTGPAAYVQCALLYTNSDGERRIRVHTLAVPVVTELDEMYRGVDGAAAATLLAKLIVEKTLTSRLEESRQVVSQRLSAALKEFRILQANALRTAPNRIAFPEAMRYVMLWGLGLIKSNALRGAANELSMDERAAAVHYVMSASTKDLCRLLYPTLFNLSNPNEGMEEEEEKEKEEGASGRTSDERDAVIANANTTHLLLPWGYSSDPLIRGRQKQRDREIAALESEMDPVQVANEAANEATTEISTQGKSTIVFPPPLPLSIASLHEAGVYLIDNGRQLYLWLGRSVSPAWCIEAMGLDPGSMPAADTSALTLDPPRPTVLGRRLARLLAVLRGTRNVRQFCYVVRQGSPMEGLLSPLFVEDRTGGPSYYDFVIVLHRASLAAK